MIKYKYELKFLEKRAKPSKDEGGGGLRRMTSKISVLS